MRKTIPTTLVLAAALVAAWLAKPMAQAPAPPAAVTVLRDKWGVPHVFQNDPALGADENDQRAAFALGYANAQDRLFQMEILRRAGKGRLAELIGDDAASLGKSAIDLDVFVRRELYTEPERQDMFDRLQASDPASAAAFRAYVDGVNLYIAEALADPVEKLPAEYVALGTLPEPWSLTDSIAFAALGLSIFGADGGNELQNAALLFDLAGRLGESAAKGVFDDLFWIDDPDAPTTIQGATSSYTFAAPARFAQLEFLKRPEVKAAIRKAAAAQRDEQALIDEIGRRLGLSALFHPGHSNALVVSGAHTATGHPMLGGGPQVGYATPSFFWESGFHGATYDSVGVNVPLGPGNIMGRTETLAYTVTSGIDDQIDTYVELLSPADSHLYKTEAGWQQMDCRTETFLVRLNPTGPPSRLAGGAFDPPSFLGLDGARPLRSKPPVRPVVQELCRTVHGPVLFIDAENHVAFARKRSHWMEDLNAAAAWLNLGRAKTIADVDQRLRGFPFTFNFHYASTDGHIAYFHRGKIPIRPANADWRLPFPGDGGFEWQGFVDPAAMPEVVDPPQGYIANWNNKPIPGWRGETEDRELWGNRHRVEGIAREVERLIQSGTPIALVENGSLDATAAPACFARVDYRVGADPLGCVTSVNGIVRKAATSDLHALTVLPYLHAAAAQVAHSADVDRAIGFLDQWVEAGAPLLSGGAATYSFAGVTIYRDWRRRLQRAVFDDELGSANDRLPDYPAVIDANNEDDHGSYLTPDSLLEHVLSHAPELAGVAAPTAIAPSNGRNYCDDLVAGAHHTCAEVLVSSLADTIAALHARFGSTPMAAWSTDVIVSTIPAQGAAPEVRIERMNRGSWNQLHDFGPGASFLTFDVVPPGNSGLVDVATLAQSQAAGDPRTAFAGGHVFDQLPLYTGWTYKHFVQHPSEVEGAAAETVPYVRGVVPQPDTTALRTLWRALDQAGIPLPNVSLLGEASTR